MKYFIVESVEYELIPKWKDVSEDWGFDSETRCAVYYQWLACLRMKRQRISYVAAESCGEVVGKRNCGKGQTVAPVKCSALTLTTLYDAENTTERWRERSMLIIFLYILLFFTYCYIIMRFAVLASTLTSIVFLL